MSKMTRHNRFKDEVLLAYQKKYPQHRVWNNETGVAFSIPNVRKLIDAVWTFDIDNIKQAIKMLVRINYGKKGSADIIGITDNGIHIEIEIKTGKAVQTKLQKNWQRMILSKGGIYIVVTNRRRIDEQI